MRSVRRLSLCARSIKSAGSFGRCVSDNGNRATSCVTGCGAWQRAAWAFRGRHFPLVFEVREFLLDIGRSFFVSLATTYALHFGSSCRLHVVDLLHVAMFLSQCYKTKYVVP